MNRTITLTEAEQTLLLHGLYAGSRWEFSLADAHNLGHKKLEPEYSASIEKEQAYLKLLRKCREQLMDQGRKPKG